MKKRLSALFMAFVMTLSLAVTAFAATPTKYDIKLDFDYDGQNDVTLQTSEAADVGQAATLGAAADDYLAPTRDGYDFAGWYLEDTKITNLKTHEFTKNETLVAHWNVKATVGDDGVLGGKTEIDGEVAIPTIKVIIPTDATVTVNPYQLTVKVGGENIDDQIISPVFVIENHSNVAIKTTITITGAVSGDEAQFATKAPAQNDTEKNIFMYFEAALAEYNDGKFAAPDWAEEYSKSDTMVAIGEDAVELSKLPIMEAGEFTGENCTKPTGLAFHLGGAVSVAPTKAWADTDTVTITIAYTFTAQANGLVTE